MILDPWDGTQSCSAQSLCTPNPGISRRSLREDAYDPTAPEAGALSRLLRLVVPQAFSKLDDRAVRGWGVNIQHDIQTVRPLHA